VAVDQAQFGDTLGAIYAEALIELADEAGQLAAIADEVEQLQQLIQAEPQLRQLLESRILRTQARAEAIETIFKGRVSDLLFRFLLVVNEKGRMNALDAICRAFAQLMDERRGIVDVDVYVAAQMDAARSRQVADRIGQVIDRQVVLHQYVDPHLIGGLKVRVGDQLIDGSVATQLRLLERKMAEAGRERARTAR